MEYGQPCGASIVMSCLKDMEECLRRIEESLGDDNDSNTYPLHLKGLLLRRQGTGVFLLHEKSILTRKTGRSSNLFQPSDVAKSARHFELETSK